jgi:two-component system, response regulator YesN
MFKVLIAEDEMFVRIGIKNSINWSKYGMGLIDDVADGQQAWESYNKYKPDIVLTDLKMPQMDGMELISKIRSIDKKTKIVILTNVEDFKSAQKAMVYGVSGYILKLTMTWEEMDEILCKVYQELEQEYGADINAEADKQGMELLKTKAFSEYIKNTSDNIDAIEDAVKINNMRLSQRNLILCILELDGPSELPTPEGGANPLSLKKSIINLLMEVLDGYNRGEVVHYEDKRYSVLFSFDDLRTKEEIRDELCKVLDHIKRLMSAYFNLSATFAASTAKDGYLNIRELYEECITALAGKFYSGRGSLLFFADKKIDIYDIYIRPLLKRVIEDSASVFGEEFKKEFEEGILKTEFKSGDWIADIKNAFLLWLQLPVSVLRIRMQEIFLLQVSYADKIKVCETLNEIMEIYTKYLNDIHSLTGSKKAYSREVQLALQYIKENYQNDISLHQAASIVNLSTNYISTVFKAEMGVSFVDYVTQYKIEKTKELLLGTSFKLHEVADKVGFNDVSYFCRVFKKITGYTPNDFKKKYNY